MGPALAAQHLALEALGDPITPLPAAMPTKAPIGSAWRPRRDAVRFLRSPVVAIVALALRLLCRWSGRVGQRCKEVDATLRTGGSFPSYDGTLVVSGAETGGDPIVLRLQFFELFGPDGQLRWKRLLPMRFAFIDRDAFEAMATAAGFRVVALMGDYAGRPFEPESSPVMIRTPERPG